MIGSMKVLSIILAGFVVGYAISDIRPLDSLLSSTAEFGSPATIVSGLTVLALTACLVSVVLARSRARGVLVVAIGAVLVVVFRTVGMVTGMFGDWAGAVGAGALLGASAVLAGRHRGAQASLAVAAVGAGLLGKALDALLQADDGPVFVWDVVGAEDDVSPQRAIGMVIVASAAAIALFLAYRHEELRPYETRRILLVGIPLPVAAGVLTWIAAGHDTRSVEWLGALAGMTAVSLVASFLLPGRNGRLLLVLFASSSAGIGSFGFAAGDSAQLALSVGLLVVGGGLGYRWPQLYIGLGGLFVVAVAGVIEGYAEVSTGSEFALPLVAAYVVVSALATSPGSLAVSLPVLFTMTLPVVVYSASYQPGLSSDVAVATRTSEPDHLMLSVAGLVVVAVVTVACAVLMRRPAVVSGTS
jgi:outer membrane lipoprotein SlyB